MTATATVPGSRVSPGTRPSFQDRRPFHVFVREPGTGLLVSDGLTYIGQRCAEHEARKITRILGQHAEARPQH
jgi:hypothetical protein